jgi:hypothetical protein|tara:strand:+ start:2855 stop:3073 length:219 start_codon:yes stop_codon:yes gene_type:complete
MDLFDSSVPDYNKVMLIINTCVTLEQLKYSEKYVELFKLKYKINEYNEFNQIFKKCIFSKKMKLKNGWNDKN